MFEQNRDHLNTLVRGSDSSFVLHVSLFEDLILKNPEKKQEAEGPLYSTEKQ